MAKKKSTAKKSVRVHKEKTYFGHSFFFITVLGGGFLVISLMLLVQGNPKSLFRDSTTSLDAGAMIEESDEMDSEETVTIKDNAFSVDLLTVDVGDTVTWMNAGAVVHDVVAKDGSFDTDDILPGSTGQVTFTSPGTYEYSCSYHPEMVGTVIVKE